MKKNYKLIVDKLDLPMELAEAVEEYSTEMGVPKVVIARMAIREWIDKHYPEEPGVSGN